VEPENAAPDDVAPKDQSQADMVLRTVKDLIAKDAVTPDIEKATGMSREQMEQFVKKYESVKAAPAGPGREINVKPDQKAPAGGAAANLPGIDRGSRFTTKNRKDRGTMAQDDVHNNREGIRFTPPPEYRSKFEGYKSTLAKTRSGGAARPGPTATRPAGASGQ
jgi:hypothetical protein